MPITTKSKLVYAWRCIVHKDAIYSHVFKHESGISEWVEAVQVKGNPDYTTDYSKYSGYGRQMHMREKKSDLFAVTVHTFTPKADVKYRHVKDKQRVLMTRKQTLDFIRDWEEKHLYDSVFELQANRHFKKHTGTELVPNNHPIFSVVKADPKHLEKQTKRGIEQMEKHLRYCSIYRSYSPE